MSLAGRRPRRLGFRAFLLRWSAIPLAFIAALSVTASYFVARDYADHAFDTALFDTARALAQQVEAGRGNLSDRPVMRSIIEFDPVDKVYYQITDADTGEIVAANAHIVLKVIEAPNEGSLQMADGRVDAVRVRAATLLVHDALGRPFARVIYAETLKKRDILGARLFAAVLVPQGLIVLAAGILIWFGVRRATRPLEELSDVLLRRNARDLDPVPTTRQVREVGLVAIAVNRLIRRLRRAAMAQQAFIGNAAHQLRTPLAGIVAQSDRLMDETDPARVRVALGHLQRSARRATRTVNQLLTLARSEPDAEGALGLHRLDLAAVVREVCADWVPEALERGVDLGYVGPDGPVAVIGDESLLREMLANLIDNALRYGARPGVVNVRLEPDPVVLAVEDDGPGIPEAERENVFRRFYRVPESDAGGAGSGLGLAIVREIATLHGARTRALGGADGRGTIIEVRFGAGRA